MSKKINQEQLEHIIRIGALERYWANNLFIVTGHSYQQARNVAELLHVPRQRLKYIDDHNYDGLRSLNNAYPVFLLDGWSVYNSTFVLDTLRYLSDAKRIRLIEFDDSDFNPPIEMEGLTDSEYRIARKQAIWNTFANKMNPDNTATGEPESE